MRKIYNRFYSDYLLPNRMDEYEKIHQQYIDAGYTFKTTLSFFREAVIENLALKKIFIHRHDIDTDTKTARRFFDSEKKLGVVSSYYFRLNTIDIELMKEIHDSPSEVGYHFEEIAQYCKDFKLKTWEQTQKKMPEIRQRFAENFLKLEKKLGFKIKSVASHGDFVNRKLNHSNHELLDDKLMKDLGIELECYNTQMVQKFDVRLSDKPYPKFYRDLSPIDALKEGHNIIYLLTHPRHWHVARWENTTDNVQRMWEGLKYKL